MTSISQSFRALVLPSCAVALTVASPALGLGPSGGVSDQVLIRSASGQSQNIADQYGLDLARKVAWGGEELALVETDLTIEQTLDLVGGDPRVLGVEAARLATLPAADTSLSSLAGEIAPDLLRTGFFTTPCYGLRFQEDLWSGYADQEAAHLVRAHGALAHSTDCGDSATIAILDTGIDPGHALLSDALVPGYDFLLEEPGSASEWSSLGHSVTAIVEHSVTAIVEESNRQVTDGRGEALILDATMAPLVSADARIALEAEQLPGYFGHGTMVAGIARLVAPGARIMPLRVFDGEGVAHLFDIVRAIYWAVDHGADVINMSFSMEAHSPELLKAIQYARQHGVVCVAAAGNGGERALVYPAAFGNTVGVAATDLDDLLSDFSNHGSGLVSLSAPGSGVVSTYPGGLFAAGWGTSFSAPLVSGAIALAHAHHPGLDVAAAQQLVNALGQGSVFLPGLEGQIGAGRLDVLSTLEAAQ